MFQTDTTTPAAGEEIVFTGLTMTFILGFIFFWFIVSIIIGMWIYRDAEKRGMSGIGWVLAVFLIGIIGLIIYLIVRKDSKYSTAGKTIKG
jgi:hypothetical protein